MSLEHRFFLNFKRTYIGFSWSEQLVMWLLNWHQPDIILKLTVFLAHVNGFYTHLEIKYKAILAFPEVKNSPRDFSIGS